MDYQEILNGTVGILEKLRCNGVKQVAVSPETLRALQSPVKASENSGKTEKLASAHEILSMPPAALGAPPELRPGSERPEKPVAAGAAIPGTVTARAAGKADSAPAAEHLPGSADRAVVRNADINTMAWDELAGTAAVCCNCRLHKNRTNPVFEDGNRQARLMFIGEPPSADDDRQGLPFAGEAGELLTKMIAAMHCRREDVYITDIVKCRSTRTHAADTDEISACLPYLQRQIALVKPEVIVMFGALPLKYLLGKIGISGQRGKWHEYMGIRVMPTFHPEFLLRNPAAKRDVWQDLQQVMQVLGL